VVTSTLHLANMRMTPNECGTKWLSWQRRLPSNGAKQHGLYDQFDYVFQYYKHLKLTYMFTTRPLWCDPYFVTL